MAEPLTQPGRAIPALVTDHHQRVTDWRLPSGRVCSGARACWRGEETRGMSPSSRSPWPRGIAAGSIALVGFGVDSLIEVLAGVVVVWLFTGRRVGSAVAERRAQQAISLSFLLLAVYVAVESLRTLVAGHHPDPSWIGIGLAAFTAVTMPLLARAKRRVGHALGSSATVSEAKQTSLCAYLSVALLIGLGANAVFGLWWADPAAALVIAGIAAREGVQSWRGEACADGCC